MLIELFTQKHVEIAIAIYFLLALKSVQLGFYEDEWHILHLSMNNNHLFVWLVFCC